MDVFFMSVWDNARRGTKYYTCWGDMDRHGNYVSETLPLFFLSDDVATLREASRVIEQLWANENRYHLQFEPPAGKQFFAPTQPVYRLLAELKLLIAGRRNMPAADLGTMVHAALAAGDAIDNWGGALAQWTGYSDQNEVDEAHSELYQDVMASVEVFNTQTARPRSVSGRNRVTRTAAQALMEATVDSAVTLMIDDTESRSGRGLSMEFPDGQSVYLSAETIARAAGGRPVEDLVEAIEWSRNR